MIGFEIVESCGQALDEDALILIEEGLDWITLVKEVCNIFMSFK